MRGGIGARAYIVGRLLHRKTRLREHRVLMHKCNDRPMRYVMNTKQARRKSATLGTRGQFQASDQHGADPSPGLAATDAVSR